MTRRLSAPMAAGLLALDEADRRGEDGLLSSTETDADRLTISSGSGWALERRGLAVSYRTGHLDLAVGYRISDLGRTVAAGLCRIHEPGDPACGETEECPR